MSTTIDQRVVEMRFDNKHFESNVSTTLSTLDKLKQKLNLSGASKGLENVNTAAGKVNMSGLGAAVESVSAKFSALQVMGVTALANITNSAVNAGKRIVSALTIDPIKTGFSEYETQINSTQTILANTSSKGTTIDDVNAALEELNRYADMTIYNFTEMTRNIGTFTAAGIDLDTSVNAIQGIANLAAVSGSTSQQASTAMYQLSQALAAGTIRLMDWNSVVNAGMGGEVFQNALKETSEALGTGAEAAIKASGSFRESLRDGWLTSEVLTETLKKFTTSGANEYVAEYTGLSVEAVEASLKAAEAQYGEADAIKYASEALAEKSGKNKDEIADILNFAKTATDAATKVKTFTQLWDVMKEAAQSGWAQTWKIIVGDFEEAKALLTPLADFFTGVINKISETRNAILESALGQNFKGLGEAVKGAFEAISKPVDAVGKAIDGVTKTLKQHESVVDDVILGKWGNAQERWDSLSESGYDWVHVQNRVNEELGSSVRRTSEYTNSLGKQKNAQVDLNGSQAEQIAKLTEMNDKQLKALGLNDKQIEALRDLKKVADMLGLSVEDLIDNIDEIDGRWLLLNSFKNIGKGLIDTFSAIKTAWQDIFPPKSTEEKAEALFNLVGAFHKFTTALTTLVNSETGEVSETFENIVRTFKGLFAAVDLVATILGGGLKIGFKVLTEILSYFDLNILEVTASIGDAIVKFHDWFESIFDISGILDLVAPLIRTVAEATGNWFEAFKTSSGLQKAIEYIKELGTSIKDWWANLKDVEDLPRTLAEGIVNFLSNIPSIISTVFSHIRDALVSSFSIFEGDSFGGLLDGLTSGVEIAIQTVTELCSILLERLNSFLNAHGFAEISADAIAGLASGFREGAVDAWNAAVEMAKTLVDRVKAFLGIHSPSTVFMAIGAFAIAGLVLGLQNGASDALGAITGVIQPIIDWLKELDLGAVLASIIGLSVASTAHKTASALEAFSAPFEGVGELLEGVGQTLKKSARPIKKILNNTAKVVKNFSNILGSISFSIKADGIKTLAESLVLLAAAVAVLSLCDQGKLWSAVGSIFALAVILGGLAFVMDKMNSASASFEKGKLDIKGLSSGLIGIGMAIMLMSIAVKMMGSLDPGQAEQGFLGLAGVVVAIGVVIAAFGLLTKGSSAENIDKLGKTMTKLGVALLLMTVVVKLLGGMDDTTLVKGFVVMSGFVALIGVLMAATKFISGSKNVDSIGSTLLKIAAAIGVMALVAKLLGGMDVHELIQGGIAIVAFSGIIVGLMAATKLISGSKNVDSIGSTLLKIALVIGVMALVTKLLGSMDVDDIVQGGIAIVAFSGIIVGLMAATKLISGSKNIDKIGKTLLAISGAIAIMAATAFMLSMISWEGFAKGTTMIIAFSGIVVGLMAATKLIGGSKNVDTIGKTLLSVSGAIGIIALIAVLLSLVPIGNLIKGVAIVTVLSAVMAGLIFVTKYAQNSLGNIIALTVAIGVIAGAVYLLSTIPAESAITSAVILGSLMAIMAGVLAVTSIVGASALTALGGIVALTALAIPLLAFVGILALMQNIQNAITNALALTILASAMTLLLIPLTAVGTFAISALAGVVALTAMAVPLLAFVGILALMSGIQNGIENAKALTELMTAIGDVLFKIALVAPLAVVGVVAIGGMLGLITSLGILAGSIGALVTYFPQLQTFIDTGIPILERLASGLGSIIGSFITGFAVEVMSILPMLGASLSQFMINAMPFIMGAKMIDESVLVGVGSLAGAIIALTAADLIAGVASFVQGGSSFADLGTQLSQFMINAMPFITGASMLNADMMAGVKTLADTVLILTGANILDGLTSWFTGGVSLSEFGTQLGELGAGLNTFVSNIGTFSEDQVATVTCATNALKALAQASSEIPNAGGLLATLVGENDLSVFASQFPVLGTGLRSFLDGIGTFTEDQVATVTCAGDAIKSLAAAANEIPNEGGWAAKLFGDNSLATFGDQLPTLGSNLNSFATNLGTFDDSTVATVTCAANAIKSMAQAASGIDGQAEWAKKLFGDNGLASFGEQLGSVGSSLSKFVSNLGTFTDAQVSTVNAAVRAIKALAGLTGTDLSAAKKHLSGFGDKLPAFAEDMASFCESMPSSSSMSNAVDNIKSLLAAVKSIGDANTGCLSTFADNLKKLGKNAVKKFVEAFTSGEAKSDLKSAAEKLAEKAADGIENKEKAIKKAGTSAAEKAVDGVETQKDEMESAGKDLGSGLVQGINAKQQAAYDAGFALGQKAVQGEKDGQQSNSPSKATIKAGKWLGEGLIIGIERMGSSVYEAGKSMGKDAIGSISKSISRISELVNSDIDSQPTIRPVLDLSDVRSGVGAIGGMFGGTSLGVSANLGAISTMMNARSQNGVNSDVVSAIDKLRKDLSNISGDTYQINGVTYDDGSNITDAVAAIVRQAKIERRS